MLRYRRRGPRNVADLANNLHGVNTTSVNLAHLHDLSKASLSQDLEQVKVFDLELLVNLHEKLGYRPA